MSQQNPPNFADITAGTEDTQGTVLPELEITPNAAELFCYSASIFSPSRIHYDVRYCEEIGHPELIITGSLQSEWLARSITEWLGDSGRLVSFTYSHRRAAYLGDTLRTRGRVKALLPEQRQAVLELEIRNQKDEVTTPGEAVVEFTN